MSRNEAARFYERKSGAFARTPTLWENAHLSKRKERAEGLVPSAVQPFGLVERVMHSGRCKPRTDHRVSRGHVKIGHREASSPTTATMSLVRDKQTNKQDCKNSPFIPHLPRREDDSRGGCCMRARREGSCRKDMRTSLAITS